MAAAVMNTDGIAYNSIAFAHARRESPLWIDRFTPHSKALRAMFVGPSGYTPHVRPITRIDGP
jgi:hypothetical protein